MSFFRLTRVLSFCALSVMAATGCGEPVGPDGGSGGPSEEPTGTVSILLTDAPSDALDSALVYVSQVFLQADSGRVLLSDTPAVYELLSLQNGTTVEIGAADLPTGEYSQLRLVVDSARAVLRNGMTFQDGSSSATMKVPGGGTSGLKVKYDGAISVGEEAMTLVVDFDVSRSFVFQGPPSSPKSVSLKPVLRATRSDNAGSISGGVTPAEARATLFALGPESDTVATALADSITGDYSLTFLPAGTYTVFAAADGYVTSPSQEVAVAQGQAVSGIDFELEAEVPPQAIPGAIRGSVVPTGVGATVLLTAGDDTLASAAPDNATGAYAFDSLDAGTYTVTASAAGYTPAAVDSVVVMPGDTVTGVDLTLTALPTQNVTRVEVLITDAPADILDSAVVYVSEVYLQGGDGGRTVISDAPIAFELLSLQGGLTATIGAADLPSGRYSQLRLVVDSARAVLKAGYSFADGSTSALMKVPSGQSSGFKVMFGGPFEISGETVVIVIDFDVSRSFVFQGPKNAPKSVSLNPVLRASYRDVASSISGTVEPAGAGALVTAVGSEGDTISTAAADAVSGAYTLAFLPPGTYTLIADADGYEAAEVSDVVLAEKEDLTGVDFVLVEQGSISGTITPPGSGAVVLALMGADTAAVADADDAGVYVLDGLDQGSYTVRVDAEGYVPAEMQDVVVGPSEDVVGVDFELIAFSSISGTVTPTGVGAQVMAVLGEDTVAVAEADAGSGAYVLEGLTEGVYTVIAVAAGYQVAQVDNVVVGPAEDVPDIDLTLLVAMGASAGLRIPAEVFRQPAMRVAGAPMDHGIGALG